MERAGYMEAARSRAHAKQTSHRHSNGRQARHINSGRLLRRHLAGFYTAVDSPAHGKGAALMLPWADAQAMQMHLDEISRHVARQAHAVVLMDRAGWHTTGKLKVPKNLTIILLPSRAPELNPVENIWQYLRANWLSNRVFEDYNAIVDAGCEAWNKLVAQPETIASIGMRKWAHIGQC